jgi:hypothetical protein
MFGQYEQVLHDFQGFKNKIKLRHGRQEGGGNVRTFFSRVFALQKTFLAFIQFPKNMYDAKAYFLKKITVY